MPRKPKPPQPRGGVPTKQTATPVPRRWVIYKIAAKQTRIGAVEAATEAEAVEKAAGEFGQYAKKLMAVPRS